MIVGEIKHKKLRNLFPASEKIYVETGLLLLKITQSTYTKGFDISLFRKKCATLLCYTKRCTYFDSVFAMTFKAGIINLFLTVRNILNNGL